jgi:phosphonate transport system substrate-binding protein
MSRRRLIWSSVLAAGILTVAFTGSRSAVAQSSLHLALTPSQKPTDLMVAGEAFGAALGKLVGVPIRVTVASDYAAVVEALRNRTADLAFVHPAGYVLANREAKAMIVAKDQWHGNTAYTSRIYVRKESGLKTLEELRGKTIAFVDPSSTSGYVYPMVMLIEKGLVQNKDPKTFFKEFVFSGSHDAGLQALLHGHVDAFASFDQAREQYLKDPAEREKLIYIAESAPIPEGGICARDGLDPALVAKVRAALLSMKGPTYAPILKALYDIDGFEPAEDREYQPVRAAMDLLGWRPKR